MPKPEISSGSMNCQWSTASPTSLTRSFRNAMPHATMIDPTATRLRGQRPPSRPVTRDARSTPTGKGTVVRPDWSAENPKPVCRKTARIRKNPAMPEKNRVAIATPMRKFLLRRSDTGSNSLAPRRSWRRS